ncbi:MAG: helix-turn-helix domain-containing protein [Lachnospiraceae bacterium]|jgi:transcriptional regulator with XRE-family HTH domain|nr:helix-turn-helix domain-containing protein [Lachnospiraceae bacterium]
MSLGSLIRERRKNLGLTLKEVSTHVGVAEATVQRWESGNIKMLKSDKMVKLSSVLQISVEELSNWISDHEKPFEPGLPKPNRTYHAEKQQYETDLMEEIQKQHGTFAYEAFSLYTQLDSDDQGEIRGEMKQMLKAFKYYSRNHPILNAAHAIPDASKEDQAFDEDLMDSEEF